ncbi:MAG: hypothetical protein J5485_00500, partial [Candidatus Methanomethylophilaceae archaeon]|nr:hypothetical protein [Candidatus Methanomethylophilaceae archaeon]
RLFAILTAFLAGEDPAFIRFEYPRLPGVRRHHQAFSAGRFLLRPRRFGKWVGRSVIDKRTQGISLG